jgi:hypothetical protein
VEVDLGCPHVLVAEPESDDSQVDATWKSCMAKVCRSMCGVTCLPASEGHLGVVVMT